MKDQNITNNLDWFQVCFGKYDSKQLFLNLCIIVGKYFIYTCKLKNTEPRYVDFIHYLSRIKDIEKQIAINKNKLTIHEQKWSVIQLN